MNSSFLRKSVELCLSVPPSSHIYSPQATAILFLTTRSMPAVFPLFPHHLTATHIYSPLSTSFISPAVTWSSPPTCLPLHSFLISPNQPIFVHPLLVLSSCFVGLCFVLFALEFPTTFILPKPAPTCLPVCLPTCKP